MGTLSKILIIARGKPGLGKVAPCIALAQHLEMMSDSLTVEFVSYGLGTAMLRRSGLSFHSLEYAPSAMTYPGLHLIGEMYPHLSRIVDTERPDLLIGCGEYYLPLLASLKGIPCCMIEKMPRLRSREGFFQEIGEALVGLLAMADLILDYSLDLDPSPPPAGIRDKTVRTGPLIRQFDHGLTRTIARRNLGLPQDKVVILVTKGGGEEFPHTAIEGKGTLRAYQADSLKIIETAIDALHVLNRKDVYLVVILGLGLEVDKRDSLLDHKEAKVRVIEFTEEILHYMVGSDLVVGRGGTNTVAEMILARRPMILTPIPSDYEAIETASKLGVRGAACVLPTNELNQDSLAQAFEAMIEDKRLRQRMVDSASQILPRNGSPLAAEVILNATYIDDCS